MHLEKYKLLSEDDDAFHLHDGEKAFPVAKKGLSKATLDKITQHFAEGGEVKPGIFDAGAGEGKPLFGQGDGLSFVDWLRQKTMKPDAPGGLFGSARVPEAPVAQPPTPAAPSQAPMTYVNSAPGGPAHAPPPADPAAPALNAQDMAAINTIAQPAAPAPVKMPGAGIPGADKELAAAFKQQQDVTAQQGNVAAKEAEAVAAAQAHGEAQRQAMVKEWDGKFNAWQSKADQLFNDVASSKIDANRIWNNSSTGQKLSATIGMILGGIGSGITGGPNYALQVIDNAISRDIESQKADLGKKENLLSYHMQQGHDLRTAQQLAMADMKDAAAAAIQAAGLKYGGDKAKLTAQGHVAELRGQAVAARQNLASAGLDMQIKGLQAQALKASMAPGQLPKDARERMITLPDGSVRFAPTMEEAKTVRSTLATADELTGLISKAREYRNKGAGAEMFGTSEAAKAKAIESSLKLKIKDMAKLGVLSESDLKLLEAQIPNLSGTVLSGTTDDKVNAQLDALSEQVQRMVLSSLRQQTEGPKPAMAVNARKPGQ